MTHHGNVQRRAKIDGCTGCRVRVCSNKRRDESHDSVESDCNAVPCRTMGRRQYFWSVSIEAAVIDVDREVNGAREACVDVNTDIAP